MVCLCGITWWCIHVSGFVRSGCATKMRQLTLSSMAGDKDVISLSALREELQLTQDELEDFIIDCKMKRRVNVSHSYRLLCGKKECLSVVYVCLFLFLLLLLLFFLHACTANVYLNLYLKVSLFFEFFSYCLSCPILCWVTE